ncbi:hypothetical protein F4802DRAFT_320487 [Xylaria palmicola]|nr:hypothetical protein F4802DRAFT_320487 [Xylaria palmicola]
MPLPPALDLTPFSVPVDRTTNEDRIPLHRKASFLGVSYSTTMGKLIRQNPATTTTPNDHLLGPLATVFSADPTCLTLLLGECGSSSACTEWLGQTCQLESSSYWPSNDVSCWPSWTPGANIQQFAGWGFYSPGLSCPEGYTSACSTTAGETGNFQF